MAQGNPRVSGEIGRVDGHHDLETEEEVGNGNEYRSARVLKRLIKINLLTSQEIISSTPSGFAGLLTPLKA